MREVWYRFDDQAYAPDVDEFGDTIPGTGTLELRLREFLVTKHTPKGVKLGSRFVRRDARKRFACPTVEEAAESFRQRKKRQIGIHSARVRRAEKALELLEARKYRHSPGGPFELSR